MKPNRRVKLSDLAKQLGLSTSTVSRALNDHPKIPHETKRRVKQLANDLSYHPNPFAKGLLQKKTKTIGVLLPSFKMSFFVSIIECLQQELKLKGYKLIVSSFGPSLKEEKEAFWEMAKAHVDGIIAIPNNDHEDPTFLNNIIDEGIPILFIDRIIDSLDANFVVTDDFNGMFEAVDYLIDKGRRKIIHLEGPDELSTSFFRLQGYKEALRSKQIEIDKRLIIPCQSKEEVIQKLQSVDVEFDAITCFNDYYAFEALQFLKSKNIRVPDDVCLIGFSDEPICQYTTPQMSSVMQPTSLFGKKAVELILHEIQQLQNNKAIEFDIYKIKTQLQLRQSCLSV
ncbi:LacI family transcriptional regulator [Flammeovirga sp. MY04]|uniref:LacI family DNA-binding transcriptional regulator n=1 Tax=Flammeovirga sp. MY04 TaxID=1191459 RepID=UPI0008063D23|nr:LacI family DNA-binding transcriptional regulator [Flammeovirga sp. MY04]ANQ51956.1 LacI family transcriptional regulator [Flammeovirga sp. MY04]